MRGGFGISLAALAAATFSAPAMAQETGEGTAQGVQTLRQFNIAAGDLGAALRQFGEQAGANLLFDPAIVRGKRSPGVSGQMSESQALAALLAGSGLRFEQTALNGYLVHDSNSPTQLGDARRTDAVPSEGNVDGEIVVTGSRIRRSRESLTGALTIMTAEDLERTGQPAIDRALQRLPQNFAGQSDTRDVDPFAGNSMGGGGVNLRGLGADSTLVLVNGRRIVRDGAGGSFTDVSFIPLVAIERAEVLTEGASAVYGADAVGGVVNLILKDDFSGVSIQGRYGASTEEGYDEGSASLFAGLSGERFHFSGAYSYSRQSDLPYERRDFTGTGDYRALGGSDFTSRNASPGTITAVDGNIDSLAALAGRECPILCVRGFCDIGFRHQRADAGKRSPNRMANWLIAAVHSIGLRQRKLAFLMAR